MATQKFYVSMTDTFMSGWGMAKNKTNKYVVECDTYEQAVTIERNAKQRSEMKYVNICGKKPSYGSNYLMSLNHYDDLGDVWKK